MKKMIPLLCLCMLCSYTAIAESSVFVPKETDEDSFFSWIDKEIEQLSDTFGSSWETTSEALSSGLDWFNGKMTDWISQAETYLQENEWDKKVETAWETLITGAQHTGEVSMLKLNEAYQTVNNWLIESDYGMDEHLADAVDALAEAAGVAGTKLSGWYREMNAFMQENASLVTDAAADAWKIIGQNVSNAASFSEEALTNASKTLESWLRSIGESDDSESIQGLKFLTENAGSMPE